jgi:Family of unknown function (DUF5947)
MSSPLASRTDNAFAKLRQFARKRPAVERCEMCSRELYPEHDHMVEPASHKLICACEACAILFDGQSNARYKRVPRTVKFLQDFQLSDGQWDSLMVPIEMAFFFKSSPHGRVIALYPGPAGAIESQLPLETWDDIASANPLLQNMEADIVALLANRVGASRGTRPAEYYLVPIDECYKLVGLIRTHWRGLSGGTEVWRELGIFFDSLKNKSGSMRGVTHV